MLNKVILIGNLGRDPELSFTNAGQGTAKCRLAVATSESFKNSSGEWQKRTDWHNVVVWGKQAESCSKFLRKGSQVAIEGSLQTSSWQDKDTGEKRYRVEVNARQVHFLNSREGQEQRREPAQGGQQQWDGKTTQVPRASSPGVPDSGDLPF